jgi:hypothetical protein
MILEIEPGQIALLNDGDLKTLIARLCELEVVKYHYSAAAVTWGGHQNAADAGIDVGVLLPADAKISGYIPRPATGLQVKTQTMARAEILSEMAPRGILRPALKDLASKGGAYVIVSSRESVTEPRRRDRVAAMAEATGLALPAGSLTLEFYDGTRIASWVNQYPGLVPWVRERIGHRLWGWRPFGDWSSSPAPLDSSYLLDERVRVFHRRRRISKGFDLAQGLDEVRRILVIPKSVVRIIGLSGVGKTRFIQALFDASVGKGALPQSEALYTDVADEQEPGVSEMLSRLIKSERRVVMIADNCGAEQHRRLTSTIASSDCTLSLITIEYDISDDVPEGTEVFELRPASAGLICQMLEMRRPAISEPSRRVIAGLAEGNARIAFALAETSKDGESLDSLQDVQLFRRLFDQQKGSTEALFDAAKVCALLYSFDGEILDGEESDIGPLASLAGQTVSEFYKHVAELQRRQLVQKRGRWRSFLPHALAHWLARRALADIPLERIEATLVGHGSVRVLLALSRRIGYLHDDEHAAALVKKWFAAGGLLANLGRLSPLSQRILANVAPLDPAATLSYFERGAARLGPGFFGHKNTNKRLIVRITRSIAYDAALFIRCATLLKQFVISDDRGRRVFAEKALVSLFALRRSGTHATAAQRATFVHSLLQSHVRIEAWLGFRLLKTLLGDEQWTPDHSLTRSSFQFGGWNRDYGFEPRENEQRRDWYLQALRIAHRVSTSSSVVATAVRKELESRLSELECLGISVGLADAELSWRDQTQQAPRSLAERIREHALVPAWRAWNFGDPDEEDPIEENLDEDGEYRASAHDDARQSCSDLGYELGKDPRQWSALLPEILASDSQWTFELGRGLGTACPSIDKCWRRLNAEFLALPKRNRNIQLLAGFLISAQARSFKRSALFFLELAMEPRLHAHFVHFRSLARSNADAFVQAIEWLKLDSIYISSLLCLIDGRVDERLDAAKFRALIDALTDLPHGTEVAAGALATRILIRQERTQLFDEANGAMGRTFLVRVPLRCSMFDEETNADMDYCLSVIAEASFYGRNHEKQVRAFCARLLAGITACQFDARDIEQTLLALTNLYPAPALDVFVEQGAEETPSGRTIFWQTRHVYPLDSVPLSVLSEWARQRPGTRFTQLAEVVRISSDTDDELADGWSAAAQMLIDLAPDPARVLHTFLDRFEPVDWDQSRADVMASRFPMIEALTHHERPEVVAWAREQAPVFSALVASERAAAAFKASEAR